MLLIWLGLGRFISYLLVFLSVKGCILRLIVGFGLLVIRLVECHEGLIPRNVIKRPPFELILVCFYI